MQAIFTKYIGATNTRGSRIKARCESGSVTLSYNHSLNSFDNHLAALNALLAKLEWQGTVAVGELQDGYVFCFHAGSFKHVPAQVAA